jgi:hypothetical protein
LSRPHRRSANNRGPGQSKRLLILNFFQQFRVENRLT